MVRDPNSAERIVYTVDGSAPSSNGQDGPTAVLFTRGKGVLVAALFSGANNASAEVQLLAAVSSVGNLFYPSAPSSLVLRRAGGSAPAPQFSPDGGAHAGSVVITIPSVSGARVLYTVNGLDPEFEAGRDTLEYTGPITANASTLAQWGVTNATFVLRARAVVPNFVPSAVARSAPFVLTGALLASP